MQVEITRPVSVEMVVLVPQVLRDRVDWTHEFRNLWFGGWGEAQQLRCPNGHVQ